MRWFFLLASVLVLAACGDEETLNTAGSADSSPTVESVEPPLTDTADVQSEESIATRSASTTTTTNTVADGMAPNESIEDIVTIQLDSDDPDVDLDTSAAPEQLPLLRDINPGPPNQGEGPALFNSTFNLETLEPVDLDVLPADLIDISLRSLEIFPSIQGFGDRESARRETGRPVIRFTPDQEAIEATFGHYTSTPEAAEQVSELLGIAQAEGEPAISETILFFACSLEGVCSNAEVTINYLPSSLGIPIEIPEGSTAQDGME